MVLDERARPLRTIGDLLKHALERKALGLKYIQVVYETKRRLGGRVRIFPGVRALYGRYIGEIQPGRVLLDVLIADVERAVAPPKESTDK